MTLYEKSKKPDEFFLITEYVSRRLAYPVAEMFRRAGVTANAVTLAGGLCWIASVFTLLAAGWLLQAGRDGAGWALLLITAGLWNVGYFLDVVDGSLARMTDQTSASGYFLDFSFHLIFNTVFFAAIGIHLYVVTGHFPLLLLAALSPICNWGLSFSAKEHVLCEDIARGHADPSRMGAEQRYRIYIDSPATKAPVADKRKPLVIARHLAAEIICFPGQFTLFSLLIVGDFLLRRRLESPLLLEVGFVAVTLVMTARVPFRLRREYRTLQEYDAWKRRPGDPAGPSGMR